MTDNGKRCVYCGVKLKYLTVCDMCARRHKIIDETVDEIKNQIDDDLEYEVHSDEYECGEDGET